VLDLPVSRPFPTTGANMHTTHRRLPGELVFSIVLIVFSLFMLWTAYSISKFESITSAGSFPIYAASVLLISGIVAARQKFKS
jgi:putative tricarboxylic transport membrane protein